MTTAERCPGSGSYPVAHREQINLEGERTTIGICRECGAQVPVVAVSGVSYSEARLANHEAR